MHNSGTYNNQWIVLDLKRAGLQTGFLTLAEQIPGHVAVTDVSNILRQRGYWPSYNVPFDQHIFNASGYAHLSNVHGEAYSYTDCPRAKIFRRDAPAARKSLQDLQRLLAYNGFEKDPLSLGDASNAIAARGDLNPTNRSYFGAVDVKVTEVLPDVAWQGVVQARCGPTTDQQPPFSWLDVPEHVLHLGQPETFDFPFVEMRFDDLWAVELAVVPGAFAPTQWEAAALLVVCLALVAVGRAAFWQRRSDLQDGYHCAA